MSTRCPCSLITFCNNIWNSSLEPQSVNLYTVFLTQNMLNSDYIYYLWNAIKWRFQKYDVLIPEHIFDTQSTFDFKLQMKRQKRDSRNISVIYPYLMPFNSFVCKSWTQNFVQLFKSMFKEMSILVDAFSGAKRLWSNKSDKKKNCEGHERARCSLAYTKQR